ncbi:MAG: phosphoglycerate kinase [Rhodospirillaceae bacterium]|nr:phosphoglycerate kinase [Rhodospirillaceae bacterium]|tara:strand:- start:1351 stop:2547 length:1197 start_codon:yes stop_codon:yes gene_type:complete
MSTYHTLDHFSASGKRVLVRVDLNVPMQGDIVTDTNRVTKTLPTLKRLSAAGAKVIILSHFGRPEGVYQSNMSLNKVLPALRDALDGYNVSFASSCIGKIARANIEAMNEGDILLLENVRFHAGEELNDPLFASELAKLGDAFVNDAFSASHRAHASVTSLAQLLPSYAGLLLQLELESLTGALNDPQRPVGAIVGGAKVSTKLELLNNLVKKVDFLIIGGGMANTFLFARGLNIGKSLAEKELAETARKIENIALKSKCKILLQTDAVIAKELIAGQKPEIIGISQIPEDAMILDAGPQSTANFSENLANCKTIIWNGPLGAFEVPPFDQSTISLAKDVALYTKNKDIISVAGGGDTVAALTHAGVSEQFSYLSTAGGAFLEWLEGKTLPGVAALQD